MHLDLYEEKTDFLAIISVSFLFHVSIIAILIAVVLLKPAKENPPPIPFFEMVNVAPPPPSPTPIPTPVRRQPEPAPQPQPEPVPATVSKPVPAPTPVPQRAQTPTPKPAESSAPAPSMEMPMDLPSDIKSRDMEMPALRTVGSVTMDSELRDYLNRLRILIYQNFNPPAGTEIARGTKATVQFTIARNGEISEVVLRSGSGNQIWDRLATRAIQITKPPPLPPSFIAENLPLIFDFREK